MSVAAAATLECDNELRCGRGWQVQHCSVLKHLATWPKKRFQRCRYCGSDYCSDQHDMDTVIQCNHLWILHWWENAIAVTKSSTVMSAQTYERTPATCNQAGKVPLSMYERTHQEIEYTTVIILVIFNNNNKVFSTINYCKMY